MIDEKLAFALLHTENMKIIDMICVMAGVPDYGEKIVNEFNSIYYDILHETKDDPPSSITS